MIMLIVIHAILHSTLPCVSIIVPKLLVEEVIEQIFPLHDHDDLANLRKTWVKAFFKPQPLGKRIINV